MKAKGKKRQRNGQTNGDILEPHSKKTRDVEEDFSDEGEGVVIIQSSNGRKEVFSGAAPSEASDDGMSEAVPSSGSEYADEPDNVQDLETTKGGIDKIANRSKPVVYRR